MIFTETSAMMLQKAVVSVKENLLIDKSIEFAARIVKLSAYLLNDCREIKRILIASINTAKTNR